MKEQQFKQLKIVLCERDKIWCYCCFHKDTIRPNLSISLLDKYYGRYKCWACHAKGWLNKEQMNELLLSPVVYKNDKYNLQTRWKQFTESCYDNLQKFPLLKLGLAKELNVSTKSLDEWLVGYDGQSFTIPMLREDLSEYQSQDGFCGVQRRFPDGSKKCVIGSHLGLMYPYNYVGDYYIFICEGFSDAINVWDLELKSIARYNCRHTDGIEEFFGEVVGGVVERIVIISDNNTVGRDGAEQLRDKLNGLVYIGEDWEEDVDIAIFSFDGAKDIRQLIQLKGKEVVRKELLRTT